ncbi:hypothetical protein [Christiangramia flava]|uniref:Exonuclease SbcC n=1 Tax=Christiangramia flava JLT2011 TaxID=1229726 RepID=A0A1L7I8H2_9FLAO|nr:hypothetical protein [Christiangramia flava]APU69889.1 Exonuclease SbcC [Christiangramia flava JLT2011]OSS37795.1 Exonuclease SbcC [Christiangramia flava JLT2011]
MRKYQLLIIAFFLGISTSFAQIYSEDQASNVTDEVLKELNRERALLSQNLEFRIKEIDSKINTLDESIKNTNSASEKVEKLLERVKFLEERQEEIDKNTVSVYKYNYSSAVLNLASMEREIKPLNLFNTSREFYSTLDRISNPMNYEGYQQWFGKFQNFVKEEQEENARLAALNHMIQITGNLAEGTPFTGVFAGSLFDGISTFINSLNRRDKELKKQSMEMLKLTTSISQFTHDKDLIETEWQGINKSLNELKDLQNEAMEDNLVDMLGINMKDFQEHFTNETDAKKRTQYMLDISKIAENKIVEERSKNPENWKQEYHDQMLQVQNLKIRFGMLTFRILENLNKYEKLIDKYDEDPYLKEEMKQLRLKLDLVRNSFESTFNPQEYIKASNEMYIVE